ncbi:MAG: glycosyltransferase [Vicinamibacterales bacterium]
MQIALVHDWLTGMRGGERSLEPVAEAYPGAELFTLLHVPGSVSPAIERRRIHTSVVQRLPAARRYYRNYLPLFPWAIEGFSFDRFDLVLSFSHCVAKSVVTPGHARHLCYCFTPMRYAWDQFDAYFGPERVGPMASAALRRVMARMARWDRATAGRPSRYLAISQHVARRIRRYYNREATIVYPPVNTEYFTPDPAVPSGDAFLIVSALVPYKRIELAMEGARLAGARLRIVGDGPERAALERAALRLRSGQAGFDVEFLGRLPDDQVRDEYRRARAVVLPGEEDFGIVPVEAQACGRPVVALARGGALETVVDGETGVLAAEPTAAAFAEAFDAAARARFDTARIRSHAERFSTSRFVREFQAAVDETMAAPAGTRW